MILSTGFNAMGATMDTLSDISILTEGSNTTSVLFTTGYAVKLIKKLEIYSPYMALNELGLYNFGNVGRDGKATWVWMESSKHLLSARGTACSWTPKCGVKLSSKPIDLCPLKYECEICLEDFQDTCWEKIYAAGNDMGNLLATPEGRLLFAEFERQQIAGLGNSFYEYVEYAGHPSIEEAQIKTTYTYGDKDWANFYDQMRSTECDGFMTQLNFGKNIDGLENLNIEFNAADINGAKFIGDAIAFADAFIESDAISSKFRLGMDQMISMGKFPIARCTRGFWNKLKNDLVAKFPYDRSFQGLTVTRNQHFCDCHESLNDALIPNSLLYNGVLWVMDSTWGNMDSIIGTTTHRIVLSLPGVFGVAYDVDSLPQQQYRGFGMITQAEQSIKDGNKVYKKAQFKVGMAILDFEYIAMAEYII